MQLDPPDDSVDRFALGGDYEYLSEGYYACQEIEFSGAAAVPNTADVLDAYVVPIALERVRLAGLPVPAWYLTNDRVTPPALLYGVNPFARRHVAVQPGDDLAAAVRTMSRQGKFVVCCQELPPASRLVTFEQVGGRSSEATYAAWAAALYDVFHLPLALVRLIETPTQTFFSAIERLPARKLSPAGRALFQATFTTEPDLRG